MAGTSPEDMAILLAIRQRRAGVGAGRALQGLTMRPFTYPRPIKPPIVLALDAIRRTFNDGMRISDRPGPENTVDGLLIATRALIAEGEIAERITDQDRADLAAYNRQVEEYNNQVRLWNEALRKDREEAAARAATAKVRKARCDRCFMLHAPGQTDCE